MAPPTIYAIWIINKSGGLIFNREFTPSAKAMDLNDTLRVASIWHSLHAIASQLSPRPGCSGIDHVAADTFDLHCFQALTGTKFLAVVAPGTPGVPAFLSGTVYSLYCDFVLKNPFYEAEMPVRCDAFDAGLAGAVSGAAKKWAAGV